MSLLTPSLQPSPAVVRSFGTRWLPGLVILLVVFGPLGKAWLALGLASILVTHLIPSVMHKLLTAWAYITWPIAIVFSTLLLGLVYFGVFTPIGLLRRWTGHDPLQHRAGDALSQWHPRSTPDEASYFDPF